MYMHTHTHTHPYTYRDPVLCNKKHDAYAVSLDISSSPLHFLIVITTVLVAVLVFSLHNLNFLLN